MVLDEKTAHKLFNISNRERTLIRFDQHIILDFMGANKITGSAHNGACPPANIDEYIYASGKKPSSTDYAVLEQYDELIHGKHCYQHCGLCLDSCPENLPIDDVLRFKMYFEDYGDEREAMRQYSKLEVKADACTGCAAPCANACPFGINIPEATASAHQQLTLA